MDNIINDILNDNFNPDILGENNITYGDLIKHILNIYRSDKDTKYILLKTIYKYYKYNVYLITELLIICLTDELYDEAISLSYDLYKVTKYKSEALLYIKLLSTFLILPDNIKSLLKENDSIENYLINGDDTRFSDIEKENELIKNIILKKDYKSSLKQIRKISQFENKTIIMNYILNKLLKSVELNKNITKFLSDQDYISLYNYLEHMQDTNSNIRKIYYELTKILLKTLNGYTLDILDTETNNDDELFINNNLKEIKNKYYYSKDVDILINKINEENNINNGYVYFEIPERTYKFIDKLYYKPTKYNNIIKKYLIDTNRERYIDYFLSLYDYCYKYNNMDLFMDNIINLLNPNYNLYDINNEICTLRKSIN